MTHKSLHTLQFVLGMVCVFHVCMGAGLNFSTAIVGTAADVYGADVQEWSDQFMYILRPLGLFMLALGVMAGIAALNPLHNRPTIYVFAGVFIVRALHRIIYNQEITEIFGIESGRNVGNMIFFFGLAATLIVLDQLANKEAKAEAAPAT